MAEASRLCQNEERCEKDELFTCNHCSRKVCLEHLIEHNNINHQALNNLLEQSNELIESVDELDINVTIKKAQNDLESWKERAFQSINEAYDSSLQKLVGFRKQMNFRIDGFKTHWRTEFKSISDRSKELQKQKQISTHTLNSIKKEFQRLKECFESFQCKINIETRELKVDELINPFPQFSYDRLHSVHQSVTPYRELAMDRMKRFVVCNQFETILWLNDRNHLFFTHNGSEHQRLQLPHANDEHPSMQKIIDIKWCPVFNKFLILCCIFLYSFDPKTMRLIKLNIVRHERLPFGCLCTFTDGSFLISYQTTSVCVELWETSHRENQQEANVTFIHRTDWRNAGKHISISYMTTNRVNQIGLIYTRGMNPMKYFEIREKNFELIKSFESDSKSIESLYPFGDCSWYFQNSSGEYERYLKDKDSTEKVNFEFPCGLQQLDEQSIIIGANENQLKFCDFI